MARIPPLLWVLIGVVVSITSYVVDLYIFFYVGLCFVGYGFFSGVVLATTSKQTRMDESIENNIDKFTRPKFVNCSKCSSPSYPSQNFCHVCGHKLR